MQLAVSEGRQSSKIRKDSPSIPLSNDDTFDAVPPVETRKRPVYRARDIAQAFLEAADQQGERLTPMQLMKLVYLAHAWMLGLYGIPMLNGQQRIEAWKYGPVIPELYREVQRFRNMPIDVQLSSVRNLDNVAQSVVDQVYERYGQYDGITLSNITHHPKSPWDQVWDGTRSNSLIPDSIIQDYYEGLAESGKLV
jgi:uncharacterized phage-associated protein